MEPHFLGTSFYKSPIGLVVKVSYLNFLKLEITPPPKKKKPFVFETSSFGYVLDMCGLWRGLLMSSVWFLISQLPPGLCHCGAAS